MPTRIGCRSAAPGRRLALPQAARLTVAGGDDQDDAGLLQLQNFIVGKRRVVRRGEAAADDMHALRQGTSGRTAGVLAWPFHPMLPWRGPWVRGVHSRKQVGGGGGGGGYLLPAQLVAVDDGEHVPVAGGVSHLADKERHLPGRRAWQHKSGRGSQGRGHMGGAVKPGNERPLLAEHGLGRTRQAKRAHAQRPAGSHASSRPQAPSRCCLWLQSALPQRCRGQQHLQGRDKRAVLGSHAGAAPAAALDKYMPTAGRFTLGSRRQLGAAVPQATG